MSDDVTGYGRPGAKCMVRVIQHHCSQTFSTYLGGWEGHYPVRKGCGAQPREKKFDDFFDFWKENLGLQGQNSWKYGISKNPVPV